MKLYNVSVDDIIQEVCRHFDSISVEIDGHSLTFPPVVFYADDMTLMTQSDNNTEIFDFVRSRLRARLLDVKPSKCLFFSNREDDSTMIDDTPITRVDSLYFLGYLLTREKEPLNTVVILRHYHILLLLYGSIFDISRFYKGILIKRVTSVAYNTAFVVCIARISVLSFSLRGSASLSGTVVLGCTVSTGLIPVTVPLSL
ncbi:hypothetical protein ADUPG1_006163, partial [Aduncisulcus paluster]